MTNGTQEKISSIQISLTPKQGLITLLVLVSLIYAGDRLRAAWTGTPADISEALNVQTLVLSQRLDTLSARVGTVTDMATTNQKDIILLEQKLLTRIDEKQDSIESVVRIVGKNLEDFLRPLAQIDTTR